MYGLIHKELRQMVLENYGDEVWNSILEESGVPSDSFLTMRSYDDSIAFDLVGASSKVLGASAQDCLELFGKYWMRHSAPRSYSALIKVTGKNAFEFLGNMDSLHDRITTTFINYMPPKFRLDQESETRAHLHYISQRQGLSPFVTGLINGVAEHFDTKIEIENTESIPVDSGEHTIFTLKIID